MTTTTDLGWRLGYRLAAFVPYVAVTVVQLVTKFTNDSALDHVTKALEMPTLAAGAAVVLLGSTPRPRPPVTALLFAGLALSWLGDVFLDRLTLGLGLFFAAHLAYISMFELSFRPRRPSPFGLLAIPWFAALLALLAPHLGGMLPLVALYGAALGFMAVASTRGTALTSVGGILFLASDSFLAFRLFTPLFQDDVSEFLIMLAYLAAQACIVLGMLLSRPRTNPPSTVAEA
ncbi:lysoplasmalogenase [Lysinimonas soli]|uniref:Lysoplasmalogenase n=1 Tax=Lysinimonas soli TaxID=1074233 RepID=A0ABW0NMW4_9MICO